MTAFLLNWVLTASLLTAAVLILRAVFGKRVSARLRYALWLLVLARLLIPGQFFTAPVETSPMLPNAPVLYALPNLRQMPEAEQQEEANGKSNPPVQASPGLSEENSVTSSPTAKKPAVDLPAILGGFWLAGTAVMAAAFLLSNFSFSRRLRRVRMLLQSECPLPVYAAPGLPSPCLFGVLRPAVYVTPEAAETTILRHVLAHEVTHFRHGDHIWSLLRCTALAVHWWNPLVWLAAVLSRRDAELACDEGALKRLGDGERRAYGQTLLALITEKPQPGDLLHCATTMTGDKRSLRERVSRIAHTPRRWFWAAVLSVVLAGLVCACSFAKAPEMTEDGPLTTGELQVFNNKVFNGDGFNIRNQFLFLAVEAPKDYRQIDLFQLFYNGTGQPMEVTEEERKAVADAVWDGQDLGMDLIKCPAAEMDAVLREYLGLGLEETDKWGLDQFTYLEEYDAYYSFHSDTNYPGEVTFTSGERKDGKILLYYEGSSFPVLVTDNRAMNTISTGDACVTLEPQEDGGYHFLSNWLLAWSGRRPATRTAYPAWDPERVIPLDGLEPYECVERMESNTVPADTMGDILCDEVLPDGTEVVCYWEPDHLTNPAHKYTKHWAIRRGDSLLRFCLEDSGYTDSYGVNAFEGVLGQNGFRIEGPRGAAYQACDYYILDESGTPHLLADCAGNVSEIDFDGNGEKELVWGYHGGSESYIYLRQDGVLYLVDVFALIREAWPEAGYMTVGSCDENGRFVNIAVELPLPNSAMTVTAYRTLFFDGENLRIYKDETPYEDHVKTGIEAPAEVLAAAREFVRGEFEALAEKGTGVADPDENGDGEIRDGQVTWDDWRIIGLGGPWYESTGGVQVEVWRVEYETHTTTPDRVVLAGGSYLGEDGWSMIGYPGCDYLYFRLEEDGEKTFLFSRMENDCHPGSELFRKNLLLELEQRGMIVSSQPVQTLTRQENQSFGYYFGGKDMEKLHEGLLKVSYGSYQDIGPNLKIILYDMGEPITDEAELEEAARLGCDLEWNHTKFTTEHLRECLTENFQIPKGQDPLNLGVDIEKVLGPYSEKYDAYYMDHSEGLDQSNRFFEGEREADGTVRLYYDAQPLYYMEQGKVSWVLDGYRMCATLVPNPDAEGSWRMISNTIAE